MSLSKVFLVAKREGRHGLDFVIESKVTGEVFLLLLESKDWRFPLLSELMRMMDHAEQVRQWVKDGVIKFAGNQVVYCKVYV